MRSEIDRQFWRDAARQLLAEGNPAGFVILVQRLAASAAEERIAREEFRRALRKLNLGGGSSDVMGDGHDR